MAHERRFRFGVQLASATTPTSGSPRSAGPKSSATTPCWSPGLIGIPPDEALDVPHGLVGCVEQICDRLEARRQRWDISYTVVQGDAMESLAPVVERLSGR